MNKKYLMIEKIKQLSVKYNHKLDWDIVNNASEEILIAIIGLFRELYGENL